MDIRIQDLSMTYPNGKQALSNLNLELKAPSMIGLLGPNGAGKSTLMKLLTAALASFKRKYPCRWTATFETGTSVKKPLGIPSPDIWTL